MVNKMLVDKYLQGQNKLRPLMVVISLLLLIMLTWLTYGLVGHSQFFRLISVSGVTLALMAPLIVFRQDEWAILLIITVHLYVDWYLGLTFIGMALTLVLLAALLLRQSFQRTQIWPCARGTWFVQLVLTIFRTVHAPNFLYGADYYINIFFTALLISWLGSIIAKDIVSIRRLFSGLSILGVLLAVHTLIQVTTGHVLFSISTHASSSSIISYFSADSRGVHRSESFLLNPDTNGNFLAMMLFIPLSLCITTSSFLVKSFYACAVLLITSAMFFTYTTGALVSACFGLLIFVVLVRHIFAYFTKYIRRHFKIALVIALSFLILVLVSSPYLLLLYIHVSNPAEQATRLAAWQTGIAVVKAHPLVGIGIGRDVYLLGAEPYRVSAQILTLSHPHNSYIELAALGGLPVVFVFVLLLVLYFWRALRIWTLANMKNRSILAGGISAVVVLSCVSLVNAGWTLAPLAMIGWLLLGIVSSPLLLQNLAPGNTKEGA